MKAYPSITREIHTGLTAYAFDKLDGSNIRAEWDSKNYFWKFGSRNRLLGSDQTFLPESIDIIKGSFEGSITDICKKERYEKVVLFFEFWGPNSFAGKHVQEKHYVNLIDVSPHKKGILLPSEYLKLFGDLDIAKLLYHGNITIPFIETVKASKLPGCTYEGVVCKTFPLKKGYPPFMFKVKTNAWVEKLKGYCGDNKKLFNELL